MNITVIGCGRWGSFLARYLCELGHAVTLYGRPGSPHMQELLATRRNALMSLPAGVALSTSLDCVRGAEIVLISVGSQSLAPLTAELASLGGAADKLYCLCMKGIDCETLERLSQVAARGLGPGSRVAVWLGPGHVQDFCRGIPNCMVIDSEDEDTKHLLVEQFSGPLIRFYYGTDLIGNELGAATKNVIGIAAGMLDGCGCTSLKGALMSRGTREVARLIAAMGGDERSAWGLCHLGDYEATVFSPHSHNRRYGEAFVLGEPYGELAEGYYTARALHLLAARHGVELPISEAVYRILYEGSAPEQELCGLFLRSRKAEF